MSVDAAELHEAVAGAVRFFWQTRLAQQARQKESGRADQGWRSAVTGGAQMDGFAGILSNIAVTAGVPPTNVYQRASLELPGFFRPTKQWDLLVVHAGKLIAAIELKSQVGPSFGNNFNNRVEEAIGSAADIWTAYRERAFGDAPPPFLGDVFMLEDCPASRRPVSVAEPHFRVLPEFKDASYRRRYELLCRKLVSERHYSAAAFLTSSSHYAESGAYDIPAEDLSFAHFARTLLGHVSASV